MSSRERRLAIIAVVLIALLVVTAVIGGCGKKATEPGVQPPGTHKPPINSQLEGSGGVPRGSGGGPPAAQNQLTPEPGGAQLQNTTQ